MEAGGVSMTRAGRRLYPIQVAEKGFAVYRLTVRGTWGHGSMPREDNAAVRAAAVIARLAEPGRPRASPVIRRFIETAAPALPPEASALARATLDPDPERSSAAVARLCAEPYRRAADALLRDSINVGVVKAGVKYNVVPGRAEIEIDCRVLPDMTEERMRDEVVRRIGPELAEHLDVQLVIYGAPIEAPVEHPMYALLERTLRDHDPDGLPLPAMAPFATDAKHTARLGVPTYGFSPLRVDPSERFLERYHGIDERVGLDALRFGLPVLYDVVRRYCG
jgi:acetylornithine deacetylase/succinyl-diaminopimelate desuccinylase-like protein